LTTHAFFKALLFLGAGAMIHGLHTQNIWEMGSLLRKMPVTAYTFLIGTLALCGIPPFSGFFSKDEILMLAFEHNRLIYGVALFTALLTAFYMTRAIWIAILGPEKTARADHEHHHPKAGTQDAPWIMKAPLLILAVLSAFGGFIGIPQFIIGKHAHETHLNPSVAATSVIAALIGIWIGTSIYSKKKLTQDPLIETFGRIYQFVAKKYYLDEFFESLAGIFNRSLAKILFWFDSKMVIQNGVNGVAGFTRDFGSFLRRAQSGFVQTYAMVFGFGIVALVYFMLMKG
jgi:NADH-quinone oxidoreductase subunit L